MRHLTDMELFAAYCGLARCWGVFLSFGGSNYDESVKACPALATLGVSVFCEGHAFLFFDQEADARAVFGGTVGDDGPTASNPYNGPARVFALLCDDAGRLLTENT